MLRVEQLTKVFDNTTDAIAGGIREVSFALEPGTFFTMLGPSGCGKTTTLRCVAGLETPDAGSITVDDRLLFDARADFRPTPALGLHAHLRRYDEDNKTRYTMYNPLTGQYGHVAENGSVALLIPEPAFTDLFKPGAFISE